ncbi:glycosyltransferase [Enterococcus bulliens]
MIFVTVGTHEQQFDRLIKYIDKIQPDLNQEVFIQTGYSDYMPLNCSFQKLLSYEEMEQYLDISDIVITHGGASTYMASINKGKKTIVVPRLLEYDEHVNNHQLDFLMNLNSQNLAINFITDIEELGDKIRTVSVDNADFETNSSQFNLKLANLIEKLMERNK